MTRHDKQIERLEQLIRVMRGLTPHQKRKHFDMEDWGKETDCGTVMCAAGFCGSDPWFRRRGFVFEPVEVIRFDGSVRYRQLLGWSAVVSFFFGDHISDWDAPPAEVEAIFRDPKTVGEVISAAQKRIKVLKNARK